MKRILASTGNIAKMKIDIHAFSEKEATIDIDGEIGGWSYDGEEWTSNTSEAIKRKLKDIANLRAETITVNINSPGGFVGDGLAIHDVLKSHSAKIVTNVFGMSASAATLIAQAGDERKMSSNALYLVHRSWGFAMGNIHDVMELAETLETIDDRMAQIYSIRGGKTPEEMMDLMNANNGGGKWLDAEETKEFGLIDDVFEPANKVAAFTDLSVLKKLGLPLPSNNYIENQPTREPSRNQTIIQNVKQILK